MSLPRPMPSRRTTLGGALAGLVVLAGCDDDPSSREPTFGPHTDATVASDPPEDPDATLVDRVEVQIAAALGVAQRVRSTNPRLHRAVRPVVELHEAHLVELDAGRQRSRIDSPAGLPELRAAESGLQRQLTDAAVAAESGALALLFASMAAAVAQRLAVLP